MKCLVIIKVFRRAFTYYWDMVSPDNCRRSDADLLDSIVLFNRQLIEGLISFNAEYLDKQKRG